MGCTEELSDFKRSAGIGCHLCCKSVHEISILLELHQTTVSAITVKWEQIGATTAQGESGGLSAEVRSTLKVAYALLTYH